MTETIEATGREIAVVEDDAPRALTLAQREQVAGLIRPVAPPSEVLAAQNETRELIAKALERGRDYGEIPGTNKPTLLKPGAERICAAFGAFPRYTVVELEVDHDRAVEYVKRTWKWGQKRGEKVWTETPGKSEGLYRYVVQCELVHRASGVVIGQGLGSCSTMESKYIDRPRDLENTVIKMAEKRALVGAVLNTFGLSDQFTQDVEDLPQEAPAPTEPAEEPTYEQLELREKLMRSHVITDLERTRLARALEKEHTKAKATAQIDWLLAEIKARKAAEKAEEKKAEPEVDEALAGAGA